MVVWRGDGLSAISEGPSRNRGRRPPFPRAHHPNPNLGYGWADLIKSPPSLGAYANVARNMVSLAAISIEKRVVWRVDGLAAILAGFPRNRGPHPPSPGPSIQTIIAAKGGSDLINYSRSQGSCVNGVRNAVCLAMIRIEKRALWRVG